MIRMSGHILQLLGHIGHKHGTNCFEGLPLIQLKRLA